MVVNLLTSRKQSLKFRGFTLLELLITIVIISIGASIAYPMYTNYVTRSKRSEGKSALMSLASRMQRYYTENNTFVGATLTNLSFPTSTENGYYRIQIQTETATAFSIRAVPQGAQATQDVTCGTLTLNQLGVEGITGNGVAAECWR